MSLKLKALGLGLLAMLATSAFAAMNASATGGGHFVSEVSNTTIIGEESGNHRLHLISHGQEGQIGCTSASYKGSASKATESTIEVTPTYSGCSTTGSSSLSVTHNGCTYRFEVAPGGTNGTADLVCSGKNAIEIHHPNCTITVSPANNQNISGVHYTGVTNTSTNKHEITLDVNVEFETEYHGGICIFLGTPHTGTLKGSATVRGEANNEQVSITAT